jgi:xylose isomerase
LLGRKVEAGEATLEELEAAAKAGGEPVQRSGKQELFEMVLNGYM